MSLARNAQVQLLTALTGTALVTAGISGCGVNDAASVAGPSAHHRDSPAPSRVSTGLSASQRTTHALTRVPPAPLAPTKLRASKSGDGVAPAGQAAATRPVHTAGIGVALQRAAVTTYDPDDASPETVTFCFGSVLEEIRGEGRGFYLQGYDPHVHIRAVGSSISPADRHCALATFASGTPVPDYTLAVAGQAAVSDGGTRVNMVRSVPLTGSQGRPDDGRTAAPELIRTTADPAANQLTYYFDVARITKRDTGKDATDHRSTPRPAPGDGRITAPPGLAAIPAHAFGFYTRAGRPVIGETVEVQNNAVVVRFPGFGIDVRNAVRPFVLPGAARDFFGNDNILSALDGLTDAPDLVGVAAITTKPEQYDFRFDQPVRSPQPQAFAVYSDAGKRFAGDTAELLGDGTTVRVTFAGVRDVAFQVIRAAVSSAAARSDGVGHRANTIGSTGIEGRAAPTGPTAGPDLISTHLDRRTGRVTLAFDEPIDVTSVCLPRETTGPQQCRKRFFLLTSDNRIIRPQQILAVHGTTLVLLFRKGEVRKSRLLGVVAGAVHGLDDQPNPVASLPARD